MLHQGTPLTPNQTPNGVQFDPAGLSLTPRCFSASASASCPGVRAPVGAGGGAGAFAALSAAQVAGPTIPSTWSLWSSWNARAAVTVVGPYWPSTGPVR